MVGAIRDGYGLKRHESLIADFAELTDYEVITGSRESMRAMSDDIAAATSQFDVQFFSFEGDDAGREVAEAMMTAVSNGVKGRLLVDSFVVHNNSDHYLRVPRKDRELAKTLVEKNHATQEMFTELAVEGVDVRIQGPTFRSWLAQQRLGRNHTKLVLVDTNQLGKQRAYIGGVQPTQHNAMWHDMMVRITSDQIAGHPIDVLQSHFDSIWGSKPNQDAYASRGTYDFGGGFIMFDAPGVDEIMPLARNLIRRAEHEVIIESPYLQGRGLWRDLAESDAETSVIVPLHNHHSFGTPSERRLNWAVGHGLNVYRFAANAGMVHGRALLADRWSLVGSNAFNGITAGRLGEIALVTPHPGLASQLHDHLQRDIKKSLLHTT